MSRLQNPVLTESLRAMSRQRPGLTALEPRERLLARLAALVAVDASVTAYRMNLSALVDVDLTVEDVNHLLILLAPIIGTSKVATAAGRLARALDLPIGLDESLTEGD